MSSTTTIQQMYQSDIHIREVPILNTDGVWSVHLPLSVSHIHFPTPRRCHALKISLLALAKSWPLRNYMSSHLHVLDTHLEIRSA